MKPQNHPIPSIAVQIPLESSASIEISDEGKCPISTIIRQVKPEWNVSECGIEVFTNGITNKIFCVSNKGNNNKNNNENKNGNNKLVFRVFGAGSSQIIDRESELASFERMANAGLAPRVYAKFENGLVCGYLPGECLSTKSVREPEIVEKIASALASLHKVPLTEEERKGQQSLFWKKSQQWLDALPRKFCKEKNQAQFDDYFGEIDLKGQFEVLTARLAEIPSPIVFSHNDLLIYNILLDESSGRVHLIDYEYAGPNPQLFDIANHLCEYAGVDGQPNYERDGPTDAERRHFLSRYFLHFRRGTKPLEQQLGEEEEKAEEEKDELSELLRHTRWFEAASHFFWTLWAIHQAALSKIPFDYMEYAITRHRQFSSLLLKTLN